MFVSVVLRLDEWVFVDRSGEVEGLTGVMATTWQEHRLVSGAPVKVAKHVEVAANELLDSFERSYRKSNPQPPASDAE